MGTGLEARIFAWFAAHLLARKSLPVDWGLTETELEFVGGQTGQAVDDVGVVTSRRGYVFVQAKHRLTLSQSANSDLANAVDQVVRQYFEGVPDDPAGARRPLEPSRDVLVICTDSAGSVPVKRHLANVVKRIVTHPAELPLGQAAKNDSERSALDALLEHLKPAFARQLDGALPTDRQIREICRVLRVITLDLDDSGSDRVVAELRLEGALDDLGQAAGAWNDLTALGQSLAEDQRWVGRLEIQGALAAGGHPAGIDLPFNADVERLRAITAAVLDSSSHELTITAPDGDVSIHRDVAHIVGGADGNFALIGDAGAGKSVLAVDFARERIAAADDVVFLEAESLAATLGATKVELDLEHNLDRVLQGWNGARPGTLVLDGVDATRRSTSVDWLPRLARTLRGTRWRVVGSIRTFDLRHGEGWQEMFAGSPVDSNFADATFPGISHVRVGDLTDGELQQVKEQSARLAAFLDGADPRLLELLRNPFNLRLAGQLIDEGGESDVASARTRQDLLHLYWARRVGNASDRLARRRVLRELCESMIERRRARVADPSAVVDAAVLGTVDVLLHDGVLREDIQGRRVSASPIVFSHPVLFDFAVAVTCLDGDDALNLVRRLDGDPELAITVRPSLDMHFTDRWEVDASRSTFWDLVIALSEPVDGHAIAAIAGVCAALREHPTAADLAHVAERGLPPTDSGAARMCIAHLASALEAAEVLLSDRIASAPALASLAATLAARAAETGDLSLADLARVLLLRLDHCFPLAPGAESAGVPATATADVMRCALANPSLAASETIALRAGDSLTKAAVVDPGGVGPVIEQVIAPQVMQVWGGGVVSRLTLSVGNLVSVAPELAARVVLAPWTFDEDREDTTPIGDSNILAMSSTRRQELEMARYGTAQSFPAFLNAMPRVALRFLLKVVELRGPSIELPRTDGGLPRVYRSESLEFAPSHDALNEMSRALINYLVQALTADNEVDHVLAEEFITTMVSELTHHQVWTYLLEAGATNPTVVGRRLAMMFDDGDLLGHYMTHPAATRLVAAVSPLVDTSEHAALEDAIHTASNPIQAGDETVAQNVRDALLGRLDRSKIQREASRTRLGELDATGGPPPAPPDPFAFIPWSEFNQGAVSTDDGVSESLRAAIDGLRNDLAGSISGSTDDQRAARERLRDSVPAVFSMLTGSGTPSPAAIGEAAGYLATGAERLASDATVLPGSELGDLILGLFAAFAPSESGGHAGGAS
jgi:hypothetical protein